MDSDNPSVTNSARQPPEFLAVGRVVRPHGIRGGLKVAADSELIYKLEPSSQIFLGVEKVSAIVKTLRRHRKEFLLFIEGCRDRETADEWRGAMIYIRFAVLEPLPEGEFFHWQIVGLQVVTTTDEELGKIEEILQTGANDVYIVRDVSGKEFLLPAIESVVRTVDLENGRVVVRLIPGLIE